MFAAQHYTLVMAMSRAEGPDHKSTMNTYISEGDWAYRYIIIMQLGLPLPHYYASVPIECSDTA